MKNIIQYFFFLIIAIWCYGCANVVAPIGGPKDVKPPEMKESSIPNYSKNFYEKQITIKFDEFIQLKNINQELIVSPPMAENPEVKAKGKELIIHFNSPLEENTTYSINMGNAVCDLNESNILRNFSFVFSTGNVLDSLTIKGAAINSSTVLPEDGALILLHSNLNDSAPKTLIPDYIAKTDKSGLFTLSNIRAGTYKIYGLKDVNNNKKFDQPNELFAFSDTLITPFATLKTIVDSIKTDTLNPDSVIIKKTTEYSHQDLKLYMFEEDNKKQYILKTERQYSDLIAVVFNRKLKKLPQVELINPQNTNYVAECPGLKDTLTIWLLDSSLWQKDTIRFWVKYPATTPYGNDTTVRDTIFAVLKNKEIKQKSFSFNTNIKSGSAISFEKPFIVTASNPMLIIDNEKIKLFKMKDSLLVEKKYTWAKDSLISRRISIQHNWEPSSTYILSFDSLALQDYRGHSISKTEISFNTYKTEDFDNLTLDIKNSTGNVIIQLFDSKEKLIEQQNALPGSKVVFKYLKPETYKLKAVFDSNNNNQWDTGNFKLHQQPEKIVLFNSDIILKPNFDAEYSWEINKN